MKYCYGGKIALVLVSILISACAGDEKKTIIQGSEDSQARDDILTIQSDLLDLSSAVADIESEQASSNSRLVNLEQDVLDTQTAISSLARPAVAVTANGVYVGAFMDRKYDASPLNQDASFWVISPKGYIFQIFYRDGPASSDGEDRPEGSVGDNRLEFVSVDCSGQPILSYDRAGDEFILSQGYVFFSPPESSLLYVQRKSEYFLYSRGSAWLWNGSSWYCWVDPDSKVSYGMNAYLNDPLTTGVSDSTYQAPVLIGVGP